MSFAFRSNSGLASIVLGFLFIVQAIFAVNVEMGREGEILRHEIETPNMQKTGQEALPWNPSSPATAIPKTEPGILTSFIPVISELLVRYKDLIGTQTNLIASGSSAVIPLNKLLQPNETFVHSGVGTSEKTAKIDGTATIEAYLPTYNPATIEVRVINADNTEELYSGESLLSWMRPNDKAKALVKFMGADQPDSMYLNNIGDWSPNPRKYTFNVKAGQRLIFSISGNPLPESYLRVTSNAF